MSPAQEQHRLLRKTGVENFLRDLMEACEDDGELNEDVWDAALQAASAITDLRYLLWRIKSGVVE
tara:strand:- start:445 stop:639 length:195 start_codon:yes stop_codon:yes gene_type:complete